MQINIAHVAATVLPAQFHATITLSDRLKRKHSDSRILLQARVTAFESTLRPTSQTVCTAHSILIDGCPTVHRLMTELS